MSGQGRALGAQLSSSTDRIMCGRADRRTRCASSPNRSEQRPPTAADSSAPCCPSPAPGSGPDTAPRPVAHASDPALRSEAHPGVSGVDWGVGPLAAATGQDAGREAGKSDSRPALPSRLYTLTRGWDPVQLPVLAGAAGWDVGEA